MTEGNGSEFPAMPIQVGFAATMTLFFMVDILGNGLVVFAMIKDAKLQATTCNFYIFALAVTDIMIGLNTMIPATISISLKSDILPAWGCTVTSFIDSLTLPVALWILSASALDRCMMISQPLKYKSWMNKQKTFVIIGIVAGVCATVCFPILTPIITNSWTDISFTCSPDFFEYLWYFGVYIFFTFPVPILIVIVSYSIIFWVITSLKCKLSRQKIRATLTVLAVIVCLLVCILPVWCRALYFLFQDRAEIIPLLELSLHWLLFLHSSLNPCIYGLINPQFQSSFRRIIFFFNSDNGSMGDTKYYDGTTSIKRMNLRATLGSMKINKARSEKSKKTNNNNPEENGGKMKCSIIRNNENKSFLGLKFSNRPHFKNSTPVSMEQDSEALFESSVQVTSHV